MRRDDVENALDALASEAPAPASDAASVIARGRQRVLRRRVTFAGVAVVVIATAASIGAATRSDQTRTVVSPTPTTTTAPDDAEPQFIQIEVVSALEAWKCLDPLQYTNDGGRTWRELDPPANATHDEHGNPPACAGVAGGNVWWALTTHDPPPAEILRVRRGADSEVFPFPRASADLSQLAELTFFDANYGWVLIAHGSSELEDLYRTLDGGRTWFLVAHNQPIGYGQVFTSARRGWARNGDQVLTTSDGGATWRAVTLPAAPRIAGFRPELYQVVARGKSVVVWSGNFNGTFSQPFFDVSTDGGRTWTQRRGPSGLKIKGNANSQFDAADARHLRLFSGERLWISDDGGRTWVRRPHDLGTTYVASMSFPTADVGWIMGRTSGVHWPIVVRTADAGRTWTDVTNGLASATRIPPAPGAFVYCPTQPLTPSPPGDPPAGVVDAAIKYEEEGARWLGGTVTAVYRADSVGAGALRNTFMNKVSRCGSTVAHASWVVELKSTNIDVGSDGLVLAVVLAHHASGWETFGYYPN